MTENPPIVVEATRGTRVESRHRVNAVAVDATGRIVAAWGEADRPILPRSAVKAIQALPIIETGAAEHFAVTSEELALASASHRAEPIHVDLVSAWLKRIGLGEGDLECGAQPPHNAETALALARSGGRPSSLHNNCSGKHTGMLAHAKHLGEPTTGYVRIDHPVQVRVRDTLESMTGIKLGEYGIDGCSIPSFVMPLQAAAVAMARFADPSRLAPARRAAVERICAAWAAHPRLICGTGTFNSDLIAGLDGRALVKTGAEGVYSGVIPGRGIGFVVKCEDGAARAAQMATAYILRELGVMDAADWERLAEFTQPTFDNWRNIRTGELRVAADTAVKGRA